MNSQQVLHRAGITYRQLDYWTTKGYVQSTGGSGSGHDREYTEREMAVARTMNCLVIVGFKPETAAQLARTSIYLLENKLHLGHGITLTIEPHRH